jgi:predicted acetyltransferase
MTEVIPAELAQQPILANLLQLYAHDFSDFHDIGLGEDGRYSYTQLPLYWTDPDRYPFLIRVDGNLAGFVLVSRCGDSFDMTEFFVIRAYRRQGIGILAAHKIWTRFPGNWEVRVMEQNQAGLRFWERAIARFLGAPSPSAGIVKGGQSWRVYSFDASGNQG